MSTAHSAPAHQRSRTITWRRGMAATGLLTVGLMIAVGYAIYQAGSDDGDAITDSNSARVNAPPLAVSIVRAGQLDPPVLGQSYAGLLIARRESELSFERGGRLVMIDCDEGDVVSAGQALAELDQENLNAAEARIRAELAAAESLLTEYINGPRKQDLAVARARVDELTSRVQLSKVEADRQKQLAARQATSRSELDAAVFGLQADEHGLIAAQANLEQLDEGTRKERIDAQRATVDAVRAGLAEISAQRGDSQIVAPYRGTIQSRRVDEGTVVSANTPVLSLVSLEIEAQFGVPPEIANKLRPDDVVTVRVGQVQRAAWVDRMSPSVDRETRTRTVFVRFRQASDEWASEEWASDAEASADDDVSREENQSDRVYETLTSQGWIAGTTAHLEIPNMVLAQTSDDKFWLPVSALSRGTRGLWATLVIPGDDGSGVCEKRAVEVLKTDGTFALVQGMLRADDRVISDGLHRLTAGMLVQPAESIATSPVRLRDE
ncbi:efflux RND transporter periplasmic adaptor subunit [Stieleria varia]|uniref:Putative efflux pump membrane fusion protein n=1 Tax=Stieleria varia TaxID=2528005 RepID=A0A5C6AU86_9BACT|nr:HlyD family efflux transporter periplasmic adaptor subunit [Stieleria varia]TWU03001.1 putative efflux pump membrane fusion protein [Stieleria varia]